MALRVAPGALPRAGRVDAPISRPVGGSPRQVRRGARPAKEGAGKGQKGEHHVNAVTPSLTFKERAEEAMKLYVSVIKHAKIVNGVRSDGNPLPKGSVLHATFELDGRLFTAMDGGPTFSFSEGISLVATCDTQEELDGIWKRLSEGGEEGPCGWLKDRFGVSWQVVPRALGEMMGHPESRYSGKGMAAMLQVRQVGIPAVREGYTRRG